MAPLLTVTQEQWQTLAPFVPIGVIGLWRWGWWIMRIIIARWYRPIRVTNASPLSLCIVTPVYNEDPEWFGRALESWRRNNPDEIVAVIDASDRDCIEVFEDFARTFQRARLIVTNEPGKRPALARGIQAATSDIVALVDSDTLWDEHIRETLLVPFADERVGGVGPRQAVLFPNTLARKLFAIRLNLRYWQEMPFLSVVGDALTCLSGRTALYRREAIIGLMDDLVHETFLGQPCISGDDKRLTSLLQAAGWKVRYQHTACVRTHGMERLGSFFRQYTRWSRNSWRTDLKTLVSEWLWRRERWLALYLIDRFISPFTLLLGPIALGIAIYFGQWLVVGILVGWWILSRTLKLWPHLREAPEDIMLLPVYIVSLYVFALLRIYAFLTLDYHGWITRWDKERLQRIPLWSRASAYGATCFLILFLVVGMTSYRQATSAPEQKLPTIPQDRNLEAFGLERYRDNILNNLRSNQNVSYVADGKHTLEDIRSRYNVIPGRLGARYPQLVSFASLPSGFKVEMPVMDIQQTQQVRTPAAFAERPVIFFDAATNTIHVKGSGSTVRLSDIERSINNPALLEQQPSKVWLLKSNVYIADGVTLVLDGSEVSWLKLKSDTSGFVSVESYNGSILIQNTKITSWDESKGVPDMDYSNGRSFVLARANGRMDVLRSEIAFLGYPRSVAIRDFSSKGGVYGLSWKIPNGTFGKTLLTGNVIGNRIHDNYFGMYMFGATGMIIRDNEVFHNVQYGIDPHDDSNLFLIENNDVHGNGNHGIIVSKRVTHMAIRNNRSYNNRLHGIMLDRQSNYNLIEGNTVFGNVDGIAVYDSHNNLIRNNHLERNKYGIRANRSSSYNYFENNDVSKNDTGIYLYGGASNNVAENNVVQQNIRGVYIKEASNNFILGGVRIAENQEDIRVNPDAYATTFFQSKE